jgi:transcriptional regulator GlxA family with amidase domain
VPIPVTLLVYEDCDLLDVGGPYEVLLTANRLAVRRDEPVPFTVTVVSPTGEAVTSFGGLGLQPVGGADHAEGGGVLVVPGLVDVAAGVGDRALVETIRELASRATLVASVCTGAFLLAEAGVLEGRPATTHHEDIDLLRDRSDVGSVIAGRRWIDDGDVVTAGGLSSGIAMALHLVGRLADAQLAEQTARQIAYPWSEQDGLSTAGHRGDAGGTHGD